MQNGLPGSLLMRTRTHLFKMFLVLLALGPLWAQATPVALPEQPLVNVDVPTKQPGIPVNDFKFDILMSNFKEGSKGTVTFTVKHTYNGDPNGVAIPTTSFVAGKSQSAVTVRPAFKKEGWYFLTATFESRFNRFDRALGLLYIDGLVYYDWGGSDLISAIAGSNLSQNKKFAALRAKAQSLKNQKEIEQKKSEKQEPQRLMYNDFGFGYLSDTEQKEYTDLLKSESDRIRQYIKQKTDKEP
jgi:hypothetical protein